ncbi:hypothetical protein ACW2QC_18010 [Virgibacillus sp. FSP13]
MAGERKHQRGNENIVPSPPKAMPAAESRCCYVAFYINCEIKKQQTLRTGPNRKQTAWVE